MDFTLSEQQEQIRKVLGPVKDGVRPEAGEGSTFMHFQSPWGSMFELVSYPHGKLDEQKLERLWVPEKVSQ